MPSSKHFGQPKETHLPADKHGESPWRRRSRTVLALPRGEVERGMCLGLFALQDNIPSLLKDESRERSRYFISPLRPSSPFLLSVSSAFYLTLVLAQHPRFFSSSPTIFRAVQKTEPSSPSSTKILIFNGENQPVEKIGPIRRR